MNYDLANKLKQAGYPIKTFLYDEENHVINISLEELIEATRTRYIFKRSGGWTASFGNTRGTGPTLDGALAHLWLALKPKRYAGHEAHEGQN